MDSTSSIYVFGDQTNAFEANLTQILHVKNNSVLTTFLEQTHYALRVEISRLPILQKGLFPRFTSIIDLLARNSESGSNPALESALICLTELACFIRYHGHGSSPYPNGSDSAVLGLCIGSLAAAAISTSSSVVELVPAAVEAVLIAFRTGLRSIEARDDIERSALKTSPVWSVLLAIEPTKALKELEAFSLAQGYSPSSRPYLSAINANSVTISGPPKTLDALLQTSSFAKLRPIKLPIHAPYHAAHIYSDYDVEAILGASDKALLESLGPKIPLISTSSGEVAPASNYRSLLRVALQDILTKQLQWNNVLSNSGSGFEHTGGFSSTKIYPVIAHSSSLQSLALMLEKTYNMRVILSTVTENTSSKENARQAGKTGESKIAIVGYSGRFPDAESNQKFWDLLHEGLDVHREIPADRFDMKAHFDPTGKKKNTSRVQHGCFVKEPGLFDARFFNMSPREACNSDPGQRLAITTAYEALEMAGFVADRTPSSQSNRVGIFYGMTSDDWREVNSGQNIDTYFIPGGNRAFTPGRINYHFNFSGPSFSIDTACSSSFAAIHTACNSLWKGDCDTAIAGGTNIMTNPDNFAGLDRGHFLSTDGNCNTFDDAASGYCRADGVGSVILKRLEDAEADCDPIYGVLLGAYTNHSAEAASMTRPDVGAQAFIFDKVLRASNVTPLDVSYIEMHGTGTQAGDATEMSSVLEVFAKSPRGSQNPLHLGSAKANVGHAESASGVTSLIKVLLMMEKNEIPPHVGIKTKINQKFPRDLKARNVNIALAATPWKRPESGKRTVFLNNFSAAGGNTALLMEDAPLAALNKARDVRSTHIVAVSAKSIKSLQRNIDALVGFIDDTPGGSLSALSYTTTARRNHYGFRAVVTGQDLSSVGQALRNISCDNLKPLSNKRPDVVFTFTGQGSTYNGMARELFEHVSSFRADLRRFDIMAQSQGFPSFIGLIEGSMASQETWSPTITQVGTACVQIALARLWNSWGVTPSAVTGHSLGEYAALHVAGVISISDAIYLTGMRAQLLEQRCTAGSHAMLAVKASLAIISPHLGGKSCEVACVNSPNDTVLSGPLAEIEALSISLAALGLKSVKLDIPFAFHSAQVEPILQEFERRAHGVIFGKPTIPYISLLLENVVTNSEILDAAYLRHACRETVNFVGGIESAQTAGLINEKTIWVEIGAHPVCSGMLKSTLGAQTFVHASLRRNKDNWKTLAETTAALHSAGIPINWNEYHRDHEEAKEVLRLPSYQWDTKNHWIQYKNNFSLTKGDVVAPLPISAPSAPSLSTPSVQRVVEQNIGTDKSTMIIESDLAEPTLARVLQGHKVNGAALCPSSLYADIALTIGNDLLESSHKKRNDVGMNVADMVVEKPLIATGNGPQLFRVSATADWKVDQVKMTFYSVTSEGKKISDHAHCVLKYASQDDWLKEFKRNTYLIQSRIHALKQGVDDGQSHKLKSGMAYKLFGAIVDYGSSYQGMREVVLDSVQHEATANVQFQTTREDGEYFFSPYWIDSLGHLAGFVMNANDGIDSKSTVFINHGWESMRNTTSFSKEKTYRTYVKMQNIGGTMYAGDVYIFDQDTLVAMNQGVKFQGVPRQALDHLLPPGSVSRTTAMPKRGAAAQSAGKRVQSQNETFRHSLVRKVEALSEERPSISGKGLVVNALQIVAEEIGISASELDPDCNFADLGVDSLLSLTTSSRLREELELDVPSSLFVSYPTVSDFMTFIGKNDKIFTPATVTTSSSSRGSESGDFETDLSEDTEPSDAGDVPVPVMASIREILAEEIGVPVDELKATTEFAELGLDSLLSLTVLARLREELELELPSTLFTDNSSLDEVESALGLKRVVTAEQSPRTIKTSVIEKAKSLIHAIPKASSMLLQGNPKTATKTLWLFPDGSGSATSYAPMPPISSDVVVYGLNCPYIKTPQDMKCSLEELTPPYISEIRRRQPYGPYYLGGWSAGGICAFDAAQELTRCGETISRLILIDSPFPIGLEKLPPRLYDFFSSIKLFGPGEPPKWLVPHFLAFVDSLDKYRVKPFPTGLGPETHIIWAKDGVCKNEGDARPEPREDDPREMKWLLNNRTDFGPNGWDRLLGGGKIVVETMEDANHFSLMVGENAARLSRFVERALS